MTVSSLDPNLIRSNASAGRARNDLDAIDIIIAKLNEVIAALVSPPGGSGAQIFVYTATGAEANPFVVTLPAARASALYNVIAVMAGPLANAIKVIRPLSATFTTTTFQVELSASAQAGDVYMFFVGDRT